MNISNEVIKLDSTKGSYTYAAIGTDGVTLIDTSRPGKGKAILSELAVHDIKPSEIKRILLTHHDIDHIGNAAFLQEQTGCEIYIHPNDYPYAMEDKKREGIKRFFSLIIKVQKPREIKQIMGDMLGGFAIIPTPGHTKGHTAYRFRNILFVGDLITSKDGRVNKIPPIMIWDKAVSLNSIKFLPVEGVEWLCMAHGEPVSITAWNEFNKNL